MIPVNKFVCVPRRSSVQHFALGPGSNKLMLSVQLPPERFHDESVCFASACEGGKQSASIRGCSPSPGSGAGTSSYCSGLLSTFAGACKTHAFIVKPLVRQQHAQHKLFASRPEPEMLSTRSPR